MCFGVVCLVMLFGAGIAILVLGVVVLRFVFVCLLFRIYCVRIVHFFVSNLALLFFVFESMSSQNIFHSLYIVFLVC